MVNLGYRVCYKNDSFRYATLLMYALEVLIAVIDITLPWDVLLEIVRAYCAASGRAASQIRPLRFVCKAFNTEASREAFRNVVVKDHGLKSLADEPFVLFNIRHLSIILEIPLGNYYWFGAGDKYRYLKAVLDGVQPQLETFKLTAKLTDFSVPGPEIPLDDGHPYKLLKLPSIALKKCIGYGLSTVEFFLYNKSEQHRAYYTEMLLDVVLLPFLAVDHLGIHFPRMAGYGYKYAIQDAVPDTPPTRALSTISLPDPCRLISLSLDLDASTVAFLRLPINLKAFSIYHARSLVEKPDGEPSLFDMPSLLQLRRLNISYGKSYSNRRFSPEDFLKRFFQKSLPKSLEALVLDLQSSDIFEDIYDYDLSFFELADDEDPLPEDAVVKRPFVDALVSLSEWTSLREVELVMNQAYPKLEESKWSDAIWKSVETEWAMLAIRRKLIVRTNYLEREYTTQMVHGNVSWMCRIAFQVHN